MLLYFVLTSELIHSSSALGMSSRTCSGLPSGEDESTRMVVGRKRRKALKRVETASQNHEEVEIYAIGVTCRKVYL